MIGLGRHPHADVGLLEGLGILVQDDCYRLPVEAIVFAGGGGSGAINVAKYWFSTPANRSGKVVLSIGLSEPWRRHRRYVCRP